MGLGVQARLHLGVQVEATALGLPRHDAGLQRHEFVADEPGHQILEHAMLFGQLELHGVPSVFTH